MIGNVFELTSAETSHEAYTINVPLPFFFSRNHGIALPTAALPYCQMKIKIDLSYSYLLIAKKNIFEDPYEKIKEVLFIFGLLDQYLEYAILWSSIELYLIN